jgi:hypothetical protein
MVSAALIAGWSPACRVPRGGRACGRELYLRKSSTSEPEARTIPTRQPVPVDEQLHPSSSATAPGADVEQLRQTIVDIAAMVVNFG